jgi:hypothetical protein
MPRAELARFSAPFFSVLPDLFVAGDDTREIHSLAPGVAANALAGPPQRRFRIPPRRRFDQRLEIRSQRSGP